MPLSQYFRLVDMMARMALRADATKFILGYLWWILEPLLWVAVFYVVFSVIRGTRTGDFLIFLMTGKLAFIWFSKSVTMASASLVGGKGLIGKVDVPKTLFPMASIQEALYKQSAVFVVLFIVLASNGFPPTVNWLYVLPVIMVNYIMIVACAFIGASLVAIVLDFKPLIGLGMMFLMFTSGIFWDVNALDPDKAALLLAVNPLAFILDAYRQVLMYDSTPDMYHLLVVGAGFGALACTMVLAMRRGSQYLALKALTA